MPSMVGGVRFGLCTGPGGAGGIAPRLGRLGPPGTVRHGHTQHACTVCADVDVDAASCTNVLSDVAADGALHALHVAVTANVTNRVALTLRSAHRPVRARAQLMEVSQTLGGGSR